MSLRVLIDDTIELNTILLQSNIQTEFSYLNNIEVERQGILSWGIFDLDPYDVSFSLHQSTLIARIYEEFQLAVQQNGAIVSSLKELSVTDAEYYESELTRILNEYSQNSDLDLQLSDFTRIFEGMVGFTSVVVGNLKDLFLELFESISSAYTILASAFNTAVMIGEASLYVYENFDTQQLLKFVDTAFKNIWSSIIDVFANGFSPSILSELKTTIIDSMNSIFNNLDAEHYALLLSKTGDMLPILQSNTELETKFNALVDGWLFLKTNNISVEDRANILFGLDVDFWTSEENELFSAGNLLSFIEKIIKTWRIGQDIGHLLAYKESGDGGLNYGGQEITELAINIKGSEFVQLIKETISDLFPNAGMTGLNVQAASEAFDVFLESMNVSLTDKLADTIDQVDEVSAALVTAFEDYRQLLDGTITKLGVDWGKDLPVSRFLPTEGGEIIGTEYNEEIFGSSKRDVIDSVGGDDTIYGEAGNDRIAGGSGIDRIFGGLNDDEIYGGTGNDYLKGEDHNDTIYGQEDQDEMYGDGGSDTLFGGTENDTIYGGIDNDTIKGEDHDDTLFGQEQKDTIYGDNGNDHLIGGQDADTLYGGPGADTFLYDNSEIPSAPISQIDEIRDFNQGNTGAYDASEGDEIDISAIVGAAFAAGESVESLWKTEKLASDPENRIQLLVDPDGRGAAYSWTPIAFLYNVPTGNNNILVNVDPDGVAPPTTQPAPSAPGSYKISPASRTIDEDAGIISFTITRPDDRANETVFVSTTVDRGTATNNDDYDYWLNVPITFLAGNDTKTVEIEINDDSSDELPETFGLIVQSSPDQIASKYLASASFTIIDDDSSGSSGTFTNGDDTVWITPTGGGQSFDGLAGNDTAVLDLRAWTSGISTSSSTPWIFSSGGNSLSFYNVESFFVIAGAGNDNLVTGNGIGGLFGGSGNDTLTGGESADILDGGNGDDYFNNVGFGDTVVGGSGTDTANFDLSSQSTGMTIDLNTGEGPGASWTGVEFATGILGQGNDNFKAGMQLNHLYDNGGTDNLTLDYSTLADGRTASRIDFNRGMDGNGTNQTVVLSDSSILKFGVSGFERLHIIGTAGNDTINGNDGYNGTGGNTFYGKDGDDTLTGGTGADLLDGGAGDDKFYNVGVGDTVVGDIGTDTVNFDLSSQTDAASIDLTTNSGLAAPWTGVEFATGILGQGNDNFKAGMQLNHLYDNGGTDNLTLDYSTLADGRTASRIDFNRGMDGNGTNQTVVLSDSSILKFGVSGFERLHIIGTAGNDTINGNDGYNGTGGNTFYGKDGDDTLTGGTGADLLDGGAGDDKFYNVGVGDTVVGDIGTDTVNFDLSSQTDAASIDLTTNSGLAAPWTGVEFATGILGQGNDNFKAGMQLNHLYDNGGTDNLTLDYSTLADGRTASRIDFNRGMDGNGTNQTVVLSDSSILKFGVSGFERLHIIGTAGNDTINGNDGYNGTGGNTFYGKDGDDTLTGGTGADLLDGGAGDDKFYNVGVGDTVVGDIGTDTVNFDLSSQTDAASIDLTTNSGLAAPWTGVEFATGILGQGNDNFKAGMQLNHLYDNGGTDNLTLDYSTLADGRTASRIDFNRGMDGNGTNQTVVLSDSSILKFGVSGFERLHIIGTAGNDTINGNDGYNGTGGNTFYGKDGDDTLTGGTGVDLLDGGAGDDKFYNVGVGDTVVGDIGTDTVNFDLSSQTDAASIDLTTNSGLAAPWTGVEFATGILGQGNDNFKAGMQLNHLYDNGGTDNLTLDYSTLADGRTASRIDFNRGMDGNGTNQTVVLSDSSILKFGVSGFERLHIIGTAGNDTINGNDGYNGTGGNTFYGKDGDDTLTGGVGVDLLDGGAGDDKFYNVGVGDTVVGDIGTDTVNFDLSSQTDAASIDLTTNSGLAAPWTGVEFATGILGQGNDNFKAGMQLNHLYDNGGTDNLTLDYSTLADGRTASRIDFNRGMDGNGTNQTVVLSDSSILKFGVSGFERLHIIGTAGNDTINGNDGYNGTGGNTFYGKDGDDTLTGGTGVDILDGGTGSDALVGSSGDDTFVVDNAGDVVTEYLNEGTDKVNSSITYTLPVNVENLTLTGAAAINGTGNDLANNLTGNAAINVLNGGAGNDTLNGGAGADSLIGGLGDDIYTVDNVGDAITENSGEGTDKVNSSKTYTLSANVENLTLTGALAINGTGNNLANSITGNAAINILNGGAGNDILNGGAGADSLIGGLGDDIYTVDNAGDVITENIGEGIDKANSSVTYTLSANVENLTLTGALAINGTGNNLANSLTGNAAINILNGGAGNDTLNGAAGADSLIGGLGNDTLDGGLGNNVLTGGAGNDSFRFTTTGHVDTITDYNVVNDTVRLENAVFTTLTTTGILAVNNFKIGAAAADADDFIIYNNTTGALLYDADGIGLGAAVQIATVGVGLAMTNADIVVI